MSYCYLILLLIGIVVLVIGFCVLRKCDSGMYKIGVVIAALGFICFMAGLMGVIAPFIISIFDKVSHA